MRLWFLALLLALPLGCKPGPSPVVQLTVGNAHACGRRADGRVACWGWNRFQKLGVEGDTHGPVLVPFIRNASDVAAVQGGTTCAVVSGGEVVCWGFVWDALKLGNSWWGQNWRQRIPGVRGATRVVSGGSSRACAIAADGGATCWGPAIDGTTKYGIWSWPPEPDERMRGVIAAVNLGDRLCARTASGAFCLEHGQGAQPRPIEASELAVLYGGGDALCTNTAGKLTCEGVRRTIKAPLRDLVGTNEALCGLDEARALTCITRTDFEYTPKSTWKRLDDGPITQLAGGGFGVCTLSPAGVRCGNPPSAPMAAVLLP